MTRREIIGVVVIIGLFFAFGLTLFYTIRPQSNRSNTFESNPIVDQRIINLKKSK